MSQIGGTEPVGGEPPIPVAFFRLPEYVEAFRSFLAEALRGLAASNNPILAQVPRVSTGRM